MSPFIPWARVAKELILSVDLLEILDYQIFYPGSNTAEYKPEVAEG